MTYPDQEAVCILRLSTPQVLREILEKITTQSFPMIISDVSLWCNPRRGNIFIIVPWASSSGTSLGQRTFRIMISLSSMLCMTSKISCRHVYKRIRRPSIETTVLACWCDNFMHTYIAGETLVALMIQRSFQYPPSRNGKPAGQVHI